MNDQNSDANASPSSILDTAFVRDLMRQIGRDGRQILGELVETFVTDTTQQLDALGDGPVDRVAAQRCAHRIRGAAGGLGAIGMQALAATVEAQLTQNEPIDPNLVGLFREMLAASQREFMQILAAP